MRPSRSGSWLWVVALAGCTGRRVERADAGPVPDGARIRVTGASPLGPSADRREVDVPLTWIHLLSEPAATGSTPHAVLGARVPCGYDVQYGTSDKADGRVTMRLRARWRAEGPVPAVVPPCGARPVRAFLVSEGTLRLGAWEIVDAVPHAAGDDPVPAPRVQHVLPDDAALAPLAARWTRGCAADADCVAGGVCASVEGARVCLPETDPWLDARSPCPGGTRAFAAQHAGDGGAATWQACVAACDASRGCAQGLACSPGGACVPAPRPAPALLTQGAAAHGS